MEELKAIMEKFAASAGKAARICGAKSHIHSYTENIIRYSKKW